MYEDYRKVLFIWSIHVPINQVQVYLNFISFDINLRLLENNVILYDYMIKRCCYKREILESNKK